MSKPDVQRDEWVHSEEVYTMDIRTDPLVSEIKDLAPEVSIVGGTFAHCLPAPKMSRRLGAPAYWNAPGGTRPANVWPRSS